MPRAPGVPLTARLCCGSGCAAASVLSRRGAALPGAVPGQALGQVFPGGGELVPDEAEAEEPGAHGIFGVLVLLGLGACGAHILCHLGKRQAKLDVTLQLSRMQSVQLSISRGIKLEKSELDRSLCECCMVV